MAIKPQFQVEMKGVDVRPETVRANDLAQFLSHLDGAITETAKDQEIGIAFKSDVALVSLVRIENGSGNGLIMAIENRISPAVQAMTEAVAGRSFSGIPSAAQGHLHEIYRHAERKRWSYEFLPVNGFQVAHAVISHEYPIPPPSAMVSTGITTLWGNLNRVGGRVPKASVRLRDGELLHINITENMAQELGPLLYKDIGIEGEATWRLSDWKILDFKPSGITDYRPHETTLSQTFRELREASGGRWDDVNAVEYVRKQRYEDEP